MMTNNNPSLDQALTAMLDVLGDYLPPSVPLLPEPNVSVGSMNQRAVGLGNHRGTERRGSFATVALKGVRLDALIHMQLWAATPAEAEAAMSDLNTRLMADRDLLWGTGFLRLALEAAPPSEHVPALSAWRKQADYRVLYEYRYQEADGAESLIARIPIHSDPETQDSPQRETTVVTDEMIRWDDQATPLLVVRGPFSMGVLAALAFVPGTGPSGAVTLRRTFDGAGGPLTIYPTLAAFLGAVAAADAPDRHGQVAFPSLGDFLAAFTPAGDTVTLGDWNVDGVPDVYEPRVLVFEPAIQLPGAVDRLEVRHQSVAFDQVAVVYLRAIRG
jgi:hypothetical protein